MNDLPEDWSEKTLGDVCENISRRFDFSKNNNVVFINTGDVLEGKFLHNRSISNNGLPGQAKKAIEKGDILYSEIRPKNKRYALVNFDSDNYVVSTKFMVLKKNEKVDLDFLYIYLTSNKIIKLFNSTAESRSGTFPQITFDAIKYTSLNLPSILEQKAIASFFSSFDNKIGLLRQQNQTLEKIAQTIFNEWFGKYQVGDELPEGWKVGKLGEVTQIRGGGTPSTKNSKYWNGIINWTSPKDLSKLKSVFLLNTEKKITKEGLKKISSGLLPKGTLLLSSRAPIGYLAISNIDIAINQGYIALVEGAYFSNYFMYLWIKKYMKLIINSANGSTFLEISKASFKNIECIIPNERILKKFDDEIQSVFEKIKSNDIQIKTLIKTRDALLPLLMRGEVRT